MSEQGNQEQMKKKYCIMCGESIEGNWRFCYLCGAEQPTISKMPVEPKMSEAAEVPMTDSKESFGSWPDNILMAVDKNDKVLGSQIQRSTIKTITFIDSIETKPSYGAWDVSADGSGKVLAWIIIRKDEFYDLYIGGNGGVAANADSSHLFSDYVNVEQIRINGNFHTDNTTDMSNMFDSCNSLTNVDVSGFNTSNVKDMGWMFAFCENLISVDVSGFDTSNVTRMSSMFWKCESLMSVDVSGFDTSNVTDMGYMFADCYKLANVDVSGFDTSNVTVMYQMFMGCESLMNVDVSGFKTSNVKSMTQMFLGCANLKNIDVSGFDTSNVTEMKWMFASCESLTSLDVSGFDTSKASDVNQMFRGCISLASLDVGNFTPDQIASMDIPVGVLKPIKEEIKMSSQEKSKQGMKMSCAVCGSIIDSDSRFCYICGAKQYADPDISEEPERAEAPESPEEPERAEAPENPVESESPEEPKSLEGPKVPYFQPTAKTADSQPAQPAAKVENSQPPAQKIPVTQEREGETVYCKKCGSVIRSGMTFCMVCGASQVDGRRIVSVYERVQPIDESEDTADEEETKRVYCKECGTVLRSGMTFCLCCGSSQIVEVEEEKPKKILTQENLDKISKVNQQLLSRLKSLQLSDNTDDEEDEEPAEKVYCRECGGVLRKNVTTCFICGTKQ